MYKRLSCYSLRNVGHNLVLYITKKNKKKNDNKSIIIELHFGENYVKCFRGNRVLTDEFLNKKQCLKEPMMSKCAESKAPALDRVK